jgi:hypothetical protein
MRLKWASAATSGSIIAFAASLATMLVGVIDEVQVARIAPPKQIGHASIAP